jgi:hypothetical protein
VSTSGALTPPVNMLNVLRYAKKTRQIEDLTGFFKCLLNGGLVCDLDCFLG